MSLVLFIQIQENTVSMNIFYNFDLNNEPDGFMFDLNNPAESEVYFIDLNNTFNSQVNPGNVSPSISFVCFLSIDICTCVCFTVTLIILVCRCRVFLWKFFSKFKSKHHEQ